MSLTADEHYYYNAGYTDAMRFVKKQIELLRIKYPDESGSIDLEISINNAMETSRQVDKVSEKLIEKIEEMK